MLDQRVRRVALTRRPCDGRRQAYVLQRLPRPCARLNLPMEETNENGSPRLLAPRVHGGSCPRSAALFGDRRGKRSTSGHRQAWPAFRQTSRDALPPALGRRPHEGMYPRTGAEVTYPKAPMSRRWRRQWRRRWRRRPLGRQPRRASRGSRGELGAEGSEVVVEVDDGPACRRHQFRRIACIVLVGGPIATVVEDDGGVKSNVDGICACYLASTRTPWGLGAAAGDPPLGGALSAWRAARGAPPAGQGWSTDSAFAPFPLCPSRSRA